VVNVSWEKAKENNKQLATTKTIFFIKVWLSGKSICYMVKERLNNNA
jgi:hypothetical protein